MKTNVFANVWTVLAGVLLAGGMANATPDLFVTNGLEVVENGSTIDLGAANVGDQAGIGLTLRNIGDETLSLSNLSFDLITGDASDFDGSIPATVNAGGIGVLPIGFQVDGGGENTVEVSFSTNDPDATTFSFRLRSDGLQPQLLLTDQLTLVEENDTIDLGETDVNQAVGIALTARNIGTGPLTISGITVNLAGSPGVEVDLPNVPLNIAENGIGVLPFGFTPTVDGSHEVEVAMDTNDPNTPVFVLSFTFEALENEVLEAKFQLFDDGTEMAQGDTVDLGTTTIDEVVAKTLEIENAGTDTLTIQNIVMTETTDGDGGNLVVISPVNIDAGDFTEMSVAFTPTSAGLHEFTVEFETNDPNNPQFSFIVTAEVEEDEVIEEKPQILVTKELDIINSGDTVLLDDVKVGETGGDAYVVRNVGDATLEITNIAGSEFTDGSLSDFSVNLTTQTIEPDGLAVMTIGFTPTTPGPRDIEIVLESNDTDTPEYILNVEAFGLEADEVIEGKATIEVSNKNQAIATGDTVDMGTVDAKQTATETFEISNSGDETLTIASVEIEEFTNGDSDDFTVALGSTTVQPGQATTMTVSLSPTSKGERSAEVTIASNDPDSPVLSFDVTAGVIDDCNGNGEEDAFDLQDGESDDCNENGTPDECEADSDNDGVIDGCDECPGEDDNLDSDNDSVVDCKDNCPNVANADQLDLNGDGVGEACSDFFQPQPEPGPIMCGATGAAMLPAMMLGLCGMRSRRRSVRIVE